MHEHPQKAMDEAIKEGITPDWTLLMAPKTAEAELNGFTFKGPGWYLLKNGTMLVTPSHIQNQFVFSFWMRTNVVDAFGWIVAAPVRADER